MKALLLLIALNLLLAPALLAQAPDPGDLPDDSRQGPPPSAIDAPPPGGDEAALPPFAEPPPRDFAPASDGEDLPRFAPPPRDGAHGCLPDARPRCGGKPPHGKRFAPPDSPRPDDACDGDAPEDAESAPRGPGHDRHGHRPPQDRHGHGFPGHEFGPPPEVRHGDPHGGPMLQDEHSEELRSAIEEKTHAIHVLARKARAATDDTRDDLVAQLRAALEDLTIATDAFHEYRIELMEKAAAQQIADMRARVQQLKDSRSDFIEDELARLLAPRPQ